LEPKDTEQACLYHNFWQTKRYFIRDKKRNNTSP